ncbi:MAG: hypothetical protein HIU85_08630 [Proteobacteria bacterium]|nr:hypothetical protein [Pseudomonadota bacterium]
MPRSLASLRALDFTRVLAGPMTSRRPAGTAPMSRTSGLTGGGTLVAMHLEAGPDSAATISARGLLLPRDFRQVDLST